MRLERVGRSLLAVAGLINAAPAVGAVSVAFARSTYGVEIAGPDMEVLFRHRALLLGIVGTTLVVAALRPGPRAAAITANAVSMGGFLVLALANPPVNAELTKVAWIDAAGLLVLAAGAVASRRRPDPAP
ncbi:hypothetical protein [Allokutzneria oryzae]|uniref:Phosphopantetheine adenylyltransferase n=1 Tax=Allokutzneria oryzae TaxID=1378989 RepID=A0ABV5ZTC4_9PSEU